MIYSRAVRIIIPIFCCILLAASVFAAEEPYVRAKDRPAIPLKHAPVYGFNGNEIGQFTLKGPSPSALGIVATAAVGNQIGSTAYDYQHNGTMGHQVEHRLTSFIHFDWMDQPDFIIPGDRGSQVQSYDLTGCSFSFDPGGKRASVDYSGYVNIDADIGGCAIPVAHEGDPLEPRAFWDFCAGAPVGLFSSDAPSDIYGYYQNGGTGPGNENVWPICDWQIGTQNVLHFVCAESGGEAGDPQTISYYRRVGAYGTGAGTWSAQRLIDTVMTITPIVASSMVSDKVAIAWGAPTDEIRDTPGEFDSQYQNDVWVAFAFDQGASWVTDQANGSIGHEVDMGSIPGQNITQFPLNSSYNFYTDLAALIGTDDLLHVVFSCRQWDVTDTDTLLFRRNSIIYHWSEDHPVLRQVAKADWDTGGACAAHGWGSDLAKISISECEGRLYCLYTQFGNADAPCEDKSDENFMNGELYMAVSPDRGLNWDRGQNLTNTPTPGCAAGDCESDYWASMARFGRVQLGNCPDEGLVDGQQYLDILYINDRHAGGIPQEEGQWTTNPVMWLATPCRDVVVEPLYTDDAGPGYGECYADELFYVLPGESETKTLTMSNPGLANNNYVISFNYTAPYSNWITITAGNQSGVLPSGNVPVAVDFDFTDPGVPTPGVAYAEIVVTHDAVNSPRIIPVCLVVVEDEIPPTQSETPTTETKALRVYNNGRLGNNTPGESMDFIDDCDTFNVNTNSSIYLYDGGPYVSYVRDGDTVRFSPYSSTIFDDNGFRPAALLETDDSSPDFTLISTKFYTADTAMGMTVEYYIPKLSGDTSQFVIVSKKLYNLSGTTLPGVVFGEFIDWDVPSDSGSNNGSDFSIDDKVIYQFGAEYNQDDSTEAFCPQESNDRAGAVFFLSDDAAMPKSAQTIDNPTWVYTTGPFGQDAPLPAAALYQKMVTDEGYSVYSSTAPESLYTDLSTLITYGVYDLAPEDTITVTKALWTTKELDPAKGTAAISPAAARAIIIWFYCTFVAADPLNDPLCSGNPNCCNVAGDANNDGSVNVGDGVYIINYVFKGGPAPICSQEGDANADSNINVGDGVYIINFVFKGGPAPICGP